MRNWWKRRGNILKKFRGEELEAAETGPLSNLQWEADYYLTPVPRNALFYEYLEMGKYCLIPYSGGLGTPDVRQVYSMFFYCAIPCYKTFSICLVQYRLSSHSGLLIVTQRDHTVSIRFKVLMSQNYLFS